MYHRCLKKGSKTDPKNKLLPPYFTYISGLQINGTHYRESNNETFRKVQYSYRQSVLI